MITMDKIVKSLLELGYKEEKSSLTSTRCKVFSYSPEEQKVFVLKIGKNIGIRKGVTLGKSYPITREIKREIRKWEKIDNMI